MLGFFSFAVRRLHYCIGARGGALLGGPPDDEEGEGCGRGRGRSGCATEVMEMGAGEDAGMIEAGEADATIADLGGRAGDCIGGEGEGVREREMGSATGGEGEYVNRGGRGGALEGD